MNHRLSLVQHLRMMTEYMRLFGKMIISNKFSLIWYLLFPNVLFFFSHYNWLADSPTVDLFYVQTSVFAAYIVFLLSIDASMNLIRLRENGALKVFRFISGSRYTIVIAQVLTQMIAMLMAVLLFALIVGMLILHNVQDTLLFASVLLLTCLIAAPALSLFFMWLLLLRVKQESLFTTVSVLILLFFLISANNFMLPGWLNTIALFINPLEMVRQIIYSISNALIHISMPAHYLLLLVIIWVVYVVIGLLSIRAMRVSSAAQRT